MLSRTAESLFWMARYLERAEATARLVEMGRERFYLLQRRFGSAALPLRQLSKSGSGGKIFLSQSRTLSRPAQQFRLYGYSNHARVLLAGR